MQASDFGILQIGLGSMGKRRVRCLQALGYTNIRAFDPREDRRQEAVRLYGVRPVSSIADGLAPDVRAVMVSTPPDLHFEPVKAALTADKHVFCEANIVTEGAAELGRLAAERKLVAAPSATMRFHPIYRKLRELVHSGTVGRPLALHFHLGNFILDWHPWEGEGGLDFYGGRKATGAGREMVPFEFEWMEWVFGPVRSVQCLQRKQLELPTSIDDLYAVVAEFESGLVATVLIEVIARYAVRVGELMTQTASLNWDFDSNRIRHYDASTQSWREYKAAARGFNIEEMYVAEVEAFVRACRGGPAWEHSYSEDERLGRILLACERSSATGQRVEIEGIRP